MQTSLNLALYIHQTSNDGVKSMEEDESSVLDIGEITFFVSILDDLFLERREKAIFWSGDIGSTCFSRCRDS